MPQRDAANTETHHRNFLHTHVDGYNYALSYNNMYYDRNITGV